MIRWPLLAKRFLFSILNVFILFWCAICFINLPPCVVGEDIGRGRVRVEFSLPVHFHFFPISIHVANICNPEP